MEDKEIKSPLKAIRAKCIDCCCGNMAEVKACVCSECPLFDFRMGKNPYHKRTMTDEQKAEMAQRMRKAREARK